MVIWRWFALYECYQVGTDLRLYMLWQKCSLCGDHGATAGCAYKRCSETFHYYCADKSSGVIVEQLQQDNTVVYLYVMNISTLILLLRLSAVTDNTVVYNQRCLSIRATQC